MASKLKPEILESLTKILPHLDKKSIGEKISRIVSDTGLTHNAAAHYLAYQRGKSLMGRLDDVDRASWREFNSNGRPSPTIVVKQLPKGRGNTGRSPKKQLIDYVSYNSNNSYFVNEHIRELTDAFYAKCYTSVFILFRKIVENLIIDILKKKFPNRIELVFYTGQRRYHDFSVVLENLYNERKAFNHDGETAIDRLNGLLTPFKKDANDKAHSWFHIVQSPDEVDKDSKLAPIIAILIILEKEVGLRT